ncbi:glycine-rich protein [Hymenobacter rubidus]|uniref:glycine-rich protein n=1 Tax=Hymenobacter rubidus TaxID=1441626 RepID=UPI00191D0089|nr:glycine-rich protein [Hymenobacter rubidus]
MSPFFALRQWLLPALLAATLPALAQNVTTFGYTGAPQTYTVPRGITALQVVATGGSGGNLGNSNGGAALAPGAVVQAVVPVTAGEVLTVVVGGQGASGNTGTPAGGYNGGGNGSQTGAGGGATDLRRTYSAATSTGDYLTTRNALVVAGGGGGSDYGNIVGGAGGTPTGGDGSIFNGTNPGLGATQAAPGGGGVPGNGPTGGNGSTATSYNAGGGGGYYGGGGAAGGAGGGNHGAAGGGGSSWATATATNVQYSVTTATAYGNSNGMLTITPVTSTTPTTFNYTGGPQYYTVPAGIFRLQVVAQGGAGGSSNVVSQYDSHGGQATGYVTVVPGEVLTVQVGGQGHSYYVVGNNDGGYNGGGSASLNGGGGGGATDLRRNPAVGSTGDYLASRNALLVAGGGGGNVTLFYNSGTTSGTQPIPGGNGGAPSGGNGAYNLHNLEGGGATTTAPGYAYAASSVGSNGTGGNGAPSLQVGGGGGGYYGGGGGSYGTGSGNNGSGQGGGGGGSSYVLPAGSTYVSYARVPTIGDGSMTITPVSIANNALDFDGVDDRVTISPSAVGVAHLNVGAYTLEAWVYLNPGATAGTTAAAANSIIRKDGDYGLLIRNGLVEAQVWQGGTTTLTYATGTTPLVAGTWNHVAATWDGTSLKTYLNGVDVTGLTASTTTSPAVSSTSNTSNLRLGRSPNFNEYLAGRLDEVRVYSAALTAAQVQADMFNTTPVAQELTNLQVYFTFDEGAAGGNNAGLTTLPDLSGKGYAGTLTQFGLTGTTSNYVRSFPTIVAIDPASGPAGTVVSVRGTNLTDATGFSFGSLAGAAFATPADDYKATTTVPAGASTGPVSVASAALAAYNGPVFTVTGPLPVELVAFTATAQPGAVALAWRTASEINSARFEVERSPDGAAFTAIGTVAAAGSSSGPRAYALADARLPASASRLYYRLRQIDQDGTFSYSPVRSVVVAGAGLVLYPNPAAGVATLRGAAAGAAVQVLDALGRLVRTAVADAEGTTVLAGLPAGVYAVRCGTTTVRLAVE